MKDWAGWSRWLAIGFLLWALPAGAQEGVKLHAQTLGDAPKYGPDFAQLDYADPAAPKGGIVTFGAIGTFDSFNSYIVKGSPAGLPGLYETLTQSTDDDSLSEYGRSPRAWKSPPTSPGSFSTCARKRAGTTASRSPPMT
jgi:microcin C transport system substrate-binding protein